MPTADHLGTSPIPEPVDAQGRRVAGSSDFAVTRMADGHIPQHDDDHEYHDADWHANRHHPGA